MDLNSHKKVKVWDYNTPCISLANADGSNSGRNFFNNLNHDCLAKVLMHLPILQRLEMEKVCQKWKEASEWSWWDVKNLDLNDLMISLDKAEEILELLMTRCCRYLTHLTINENQYPWMNELLKNNSQNIIHFSINTINPDGYNISNNNLVEIISSMSKLKYLKVTMNNDNAGNFFNQIVEKLPNDIEEIIFNIPRRVWNDYREAPVLDRFNGLCALSLQGFILTNTTLESIIKNKNTLVKLDLSKNKFPSNAPEIFPHLKNLEHLILIEVMNFCMSEIVSIAYSCLKLKHFCFDMWDSDGDTIIIPYRFFRELRFINFEYLDFSEIDCSSVYNVDKIISDNWTTAKHLNIKVHYSIYLLNASQDIIKLKNLEYLNLGSTVINGKSFIKITRNCSELKKLDMDFRHFPKSVLENLKNLKKLETLNLRNLENLTGNVLTKIAKNCKNLVDLNLESCNKVTKASLMQVGKLKHLKKLVLNFITNVPNKMFDDLYELEHLSCFACTSVTDEGIIKVIDNCKKLYYVNAFKTGITVRTPAHASKRKFIFKKLWIKTGFLGEDYHRENANASTPYLYTSIL